MNKGLLTLLASIGLLCSTSTFADCLVGGTDFDTKPELCCPILPSNGEVDGGGWYDENLDWDKLCKGNMFDVVQAVQQFGLLSNAFSTNSSIDMTDVSPIFLSNSLTPDDNGIQYGKSIVTAQPKLINPFLKANKTKNNMFVNVGSAKEFPMLSYSVNGLEPGEDVELTFTVYDLFDVTYFAYLNDTVCKKPGVSMQDFITSYNLQNDGTIGGGNKLEFGVTSSADVKPGATLFNAWQRNSLTRTNLSKEETVTLAHGGSADVTYTTTVPSSGSLTFYFYRVSDAYKIPVGIDNIRVYSTAKPSITYGGNPCPLQPLKIFAKQSYPAGTIFSWKEVKTGQTSSSISFDFIPEIENEDYTVTLEIQLPGCDPISSEPIKVHSGVCCKSADNVPMAMTNLFYDDFGNFVSDDTYEWTDRLGEIHTEKLPAGSMHNSQSIEMTYHTPCARAYNIESTGATLNVPYLRDAGPNKELYDKGLYVVSAHGGYGTGVQLDYDGFKSGLQPLESTGGMLQFDLINPSPITDDGVQDDFFEIDIEHICVDKEITFGAAFASISQYPGCVAITLEYKDKVLAKEQKSFTGGSDGWKDIAGTFTVKQSDIEGSTNEDEEVTIKMKVKHDPSCVPADASDTRDYAIDDIVFKVCTPPEVNVTSTVKSSKDILNLCTGDELTLTSVITDAAAQFYTYTNGAIDPTKEVGYVYQYTYDDPGNDDAVWTTVHLDQAKVLKDKEFVIKVEDYLDIFSSLTDGQFIYFRIVVGEYNYLNTSNKWINKSAFSPCRNVSISTMPVKAGLNCDACEPVKEASIISRDPVTKITTNAKGEKEVTLCPGKTAYLTTEAFEPTDPTVMGIEQGPDDEPRKYIASWHQGSKTAAGKPGIGYAAGNPTSDFNVNWEEEGWYYLLVKDIEFPESENCYKWDSIHVIAGDPITATLDAQEFCEGKMETPEETKKIGGSEIVDYDVLWYNITSLSDDTTGKGMAEPSVIALTAPTEYYYALRDKATGCVGSVQTHTVTVDKVPENQVTGKAEYTKNEAIENGGTFMENLQQRSTIPFNTVNAGMTGNKLMIGRLDIATSTEPSQFDASALTASQYMTAQKAQPTPAPDAGAVDLTSTDDEYLYYYTYIESKKGCVSDTQYIQVLIKGAPSPVTFNDKYCVNSPDEEVKHISAYAKLSEDAEAGSVLVFYDESGAQMDSTMSPEVSTPGKHVYYASQKGPGGESKKQEIVIEVYGVADTKLTEDYAEYCKGDVSKKVQEVVVSGTSTDPAWIKDASDADTYFEYFMTEPTSNKKSSGADVTGMNVSTEADGIKAYYARMAYKISADKVCYGAHVEYPVEVSSVAVPGVSGAITYLKDEGKDAPYKKPTDQDGDVISTAAGCASCDIVWYSAESDGSMIREEDATPVYDANLVGNKTTTYYLKQKMTLQNSGKVCWSDFKKVEIIVSGFPTPKVSDMEVCEGSPSLKDTIGAKTVAVSTAAEGTDGSKASDFKLVWYKSRADGTMDESQEYSQIELSPSIQATTPGDTTPYTYYVLQRLKSSLSEPYAQSAAVAVTVTVYPTPRLVTHDPTPKCAGEEQDLTELFDVSPVECTTDYMNSGTSETVSHLVDKGGQYTVQGHYKINNSGEECKSSEETVYVEFHKLTSGIVGDATTCPGSEVTLTADAKVEVEGGRSSATPNIYYDWKNNRNSETGSAATYRTGTSGLEATGNTMEVTLVATSDACNGERAVTKTHTIEVGDGPLSGSITFSETGNGLGDKTETIRSGKRLYYNSCGTEVDIKLADVDNERGLSYTLTKESGGTPVSGVFSSELLGSTNFSASTGKYTVSYTNKCPTKLEFEILDYSLDATESHGDLEICEGTPWWAEITVTKKNEEPTVEWQHDGLPVAGESDLKLSIAQTKKEDSGKYTYTLKSAGCKFEGKIAKGLALKVKPVAKIKPESYQTKYEVVRGNSLTINLAFDPPTDVSEIEANSGIKWTGVSATGAVANIASVDKDYDIKVIAENGDYCRADAQMEVLVDAKLSLKARPKREDICQGESTILYIDTTGTGKILHEGNLTFGVVETTSAGPKSYDLRNARNEGGVLALEVSPEHDAKYTVTYVYNNPSATADQTQDLSITSGLEIAVHEKFNVVPSTPGPVCEGDPVTVDILRRTPADTELDWSSNPADEFLNGDNTGATFMPKHTASGVGAQAKTYTVIAKNKWCEETPFTFPLTVHKPITPYVDGPDKICQFEELTLDASRSAADTYEWQYLEKDSVFTGATAKVIAEPYSASFIVKMTRGKCEAEITKDVEVTSVPMVMKVDQVDIRMVVIDLDPGTGTEPFRFIIDGNENDPEVGNFERDGLTYGEHTVKVVDDVNCSSEFKFVVNSPSIEIPFIVSPDGNGVNETFKVKGLSEGYPDAKVKIFDRWGKELASYNAGDGPDWDGTYNGSKMPSTDYWYEIQIKEIKKTYTGHFTLIRQ